MSIVPEDFLSSAKQLAAEKSEISLRNTVSRAYYAAFHQARLVFPPDEAFIRAQNTGMHTAYIDQLMQADPGSTMRKIAVKLSSLKGKRTKADYRLDDDFPAYMAAMQIESAEEVFRLLDDAGESGVGDIQPQALGESFTQVAIEPHQTGKPRLQRIT